MPSISGAIFVACTLATAIYGAPAGDAAPQHLARRGLSWPGRVFGSDRWGVVLGPAPQIALNPEKGAASTSTTVSSTVAPAVNPAASPTGLSASSSALEFTPIFSSSSSIASTVSSSSTTKTLPTAGRTAVLVTPSSAATRSPTAASSKPPATTPKTTATVRPSPSRQAPAPKPTTNTTKTQTQTQEPEPVKPTPSTAAPTRPITRPTTQAPAPKPSTTQIVRPPVQTQPPSTGGGGSGGTSSADEAAYLKGHNDMRAKHGARPLTWSDALAAKAQQWANGCKFQHSQGTLGPFGENLAAGSVPFGIAAAIQSWNNEVSEYDPSNPQASHFTQVVWKATTQVGCAVQTCNGIFDSGPADYYVCEYSPAGNVIGQITANVQP